MVPEFKKFHLLRLFVVYGANVTPCSRCGYQLQGIRRKNVYPHFRILRFRCPLDSEEAGSRYEFLRSLSFKRREGKTEDEVVTRKKSEEISETSAQIRIFCPVESGGTREAGTAKEPLTFPACSGGKFRIIPGFVPLDESGEKKIGKVKNFRKKA